MKRLLLLCTLATSSIAFVGSARADQFVISFTSISTVGEVISGSATFDATALGGGVFQVTGVEPGGSVNASGFVTSSAITGISSFQGADNELFFPADPAFFDFDGLSFGLANGVNVNLYSPVGSTLEAIEVLPDTVGNSIGINASVTQVESAGPVPEPSGLVLVGTSVLGAAGMLRKRFLA